MSKADDIVSDLAPLKGEKGSLHEGGIRVPLIVKYPKMIKSFGGCHTTCSEPTISYDFYPTFVAAAKGTLPENQTIDGLNIASFVADISWEAVSKNENPNLTAKQSIGIIPTHTKGTIHDRPAGAIRERDWKLIEYLESGATCPVCRC